jgi:opacity protein-like surface antigen
MQGRLLVRKTILWAAAALVGVPAALSAQAAGPSVEPTTWDLFAGGSFARLQSVATSPTSSNNRNAVGWEVSVSERPYERYRWLGGTIEGSGDDSSSSFSSLGVSYSYAQHLYTLMGGPLVMLPKGRVRPFGRVLFGDTFSNVALAGGLTPGTTNTRAFGYSLGGGVDFLVSRSWAIRAQGDWVRGRVSIAQSSGTTRGALGVVYKF